MKTASKNAKINELMIDVVEYAFIEWLTRRGIFAAFKANYEQDSMPHRDFRKWVRSYIRRSLSGSRLGPSRLVSSAFLFYQTLEGSDFWLKQSASWERFCAELQVKL